MSVKKILFLVIELVLCYVKGYEEKSSLAFVIDRTSSMHKEIAQVKKATEKVFKSVVYSNTSHIDNFILVTFDDPNVHVRTDTRDRGEFENSLSEIVLVNGGDCPESSMSGIEMALDIVHPNSFIYVFTDASAKDYDKMEVVKSLSQKKSTQVNFLLTGVCSFASSKTFVVYEQIAEATSGYVFNIKKDDVSKVLDFVSNSLKSISTIINRKDFVDTLDQQLQFTIDSKHSDVFISTSSSTPDITVLNSAGKEVEVVLFLSTEKNKIVKLKNEVKGLYFIKLNNKEKTLVTVSASTTIWFQHGFSTILPTSLEETSIKPSGDPITDKHFLSIKLYNSARDVLLETVDLVDTNDSIIKTEHLKLQNEDQQFYLTKSFEVPYKPFRIAINGLTKSKEKIRRVTTTTVEYPNQDVVDMEENVNFPPQVTLLGDSHIKLEYNKNISIKCKVLAIPTPNITWIDDNGEFYKHEVINLDSPKYLSVLYVEKATKNVKLTCKATNEEGQDEKSVTLEVNRNKFLTILEYPKDIKIKYKKSEELQCAVDAYPPAQISWYRNNKKLSNNENFEIVPDNTTLRIKQMQPYLKGKYYVEITNELKTEKKFFNVFIDGAKPVINKTIETYITIWNSETDIYCSIIKGEPEPVIKWRYKKNITSTEFEELNQIGSVYHFKPAEKEHNGIYMCIAENDLGKDTFNIEVVVQYAPKLISSISNVRKRVGENLTLPCKVSGNPTPTPTVNWFFNNETKIEKISSIKNSTIYSFTVTLGHEGSYSCLAKNKIGEDKINIKVAAIILPTIEPPESSLITLKTGEELKLTCKAHGHPEPKIEWKYYSFDKKQQNIPKSKNSIYSKVKIQLYDAGLYVCVASNTLVSRDSKNMTIRVEIAAAPQFEAMTHILEGVLGDLVLHVPCKTLNTPVPTITWEYKTNERTKGKSITEGGGDYVIDSLNTLVLKKITKNTEGLYKCIAKNAYGTASHEYEIQIKDFPQPSKEDLERIILKEEGKSITLDCPYPSDSGERYTRWYKNRNVIKICTNTKCTLELSSMTTADSGIYTCRVSTIYDSYTTHKNIIVGFKPRFRGEVESIIRFKENGDASLNCGAYGEPAPKIKWYHDSSKVLDKSDYYNFKMTVDYVGKYECIVSNAFGTISRNFEIQSDNVCEMNIPYKRNMPLFLTRKLAWILTNNITINTDIRIDCIKHFISDGKRTFISPLFATCIGKTIFKTDYGNIDISELKCDNPIELKIRGNNESCTKGNSELLQVGFEIKTNFLPIYDVCIDKVKNYPCFTKYALNENAANSSPKEIVHFVESSYIPFKFEDLYDCSKQVGSIFATTGVNISEGNKCCFARKQLVSPKDMLPGLHQLATYNNVNVIPQWSTCGTENWDEVGRRVRSLAMSRRTILEVWTGSSESMTLPNQKSDTPVKINDKYDRSQRVPLYIWKLVISEQNSGEELMKEGLAIVLMNSPNLKADAVERIPCKKDICNETKWMYSSQWRDPSKGFVFCCNVTDFMSTFNYNNLFPSMKPLNSISDGTTEINLCEFTNNYFVTGGMDNSSIRSTTMIL